MSRRIDAYLGEAQEGLIVGAVEHTRHRRSREVHLQVGCSIAACHRRLLKHDHGVLTGQEEAAPAGRRVVRGSFEIRIAFSKLL